MKPISQTAQNYQGSGIRAMFTIAAKHPGYVNLCNGEPDFETPQYIKDSAVRALEGGFTRYASQYGSDSFRQAVADKYIRQFGKPFGPENVCAALGGVEGIMLALMALIDPGDEVLIPDPSYTCYPSQVEALGGKVVRVPLYEKDGFKLTPETLEKYITPKTKVLIVNYPNNPVGALLTPEAADKLADVIEKHDLYVLSDEVYEKIVFDGRKHYSLAQVERIQNNVIIVNSLSKTYAMTGWRVGYLVGEPGLIEHIGEMQQSLAACLPSFILEAAADAISGNQIPVQAMVDEYAVRRDILLEELGDVPGIQTFRTEGSFCTFINIKDLGIKSEQMAIDLIEKAGVLTVGGQAFGEMGEGYLRVCFANNQEAVREGAKRIADYVKSIR